MLSVQPIFYPTRPQTKKATVGNESDEMEDEFSFVDDKKDANFVPSRSVPRNPMGSISRTPMGSTPRGPMGSVGFGKSGPRMPFALAPNVDQRVTRTGFTPNFQGVGYILPRDRVGPRQPAPQLIGPARSYMFRVDQGGLFQKKKFLKILKIFLKIFFGNFFFRQNKGWSIWRRIFENRFETEIIDVGGKKTRKRLFIRYQ